MSAVSENVSNIITYVRKLVNPDKSTMNKYDFITLKKVRVSEGFGIVEELRRRESPTRKKTDHAAIARSSDLPVEREIRNH